MQRLLVLLFMVFTLSGVAFSQQMSDDQVIEYVKKAQLAGKSQKQITTELMRRGVTREQVERIKAKNEDKSNSYGAEENTDSKKDSRKRDKSKKEEEEKTEKQSLRKKPVTDKDEKEMTEDELETTEEEEISSKSEKSKEPTVNDIFGHNLFSNKRLTFEPNMNIATPDNYKLGPEDEVIIDVWGASEITIRETISPEGTILVKGLGPVQLGGMTVKEANHHLQQEFAKIYAGVGGDKPNSQIKLTLGNIRTIQINVMGEVYMPGTYTLSAFASVFHALYQAGGVNKIGSLRDIQVVRNGNPIANIDVYKVLMNGELKNDIRLQDGDFIIVNPYQSLVQILGKVKRPMFYEMKASETLASLLKYTGGFTGDAYKKAVRVVRKSGREHQIYNVDEMDFSVFRLDDGDVVTVDSVLQRFENMVEIRGAVYREGLYQLNGKVNTVKTLLSAAEGVRGDAFLNRSIIDREKEDLTHEIIQVDLKGLLNGTTVDIPLKKNDILYIPSIHDLQEEATISIHGEVANPGTYLFSENSTVEDLIVQAGGLLESAATIKVEVSRRIKNPKQNTFNSTIGETFSFDLKDGLVVGDRSKDFHLEPFDEIYIRKSPTYHKQQNVLIAGEVLFSGNYALSKKNERLSDLVKKAGGVTPEAYIKGARLIRKMTEDEIRRKEDAIKMAQMSSGDSIDIKKLDLSDIYSVGIYLDKALQHPGSDYDMILREGDILYVPEYVSTVKINGAVMYPNTVAYKAGENLKYYINQAGGFGDNAKKRKAYVVYMNGTVSRIKSHSVNMIEPGCEIIVPTKDAKKKMSPAEIIGLGTSTASLATMIATIVNLFK